MPDDPDAIFRLATAAKRIATVFHNVKGSSWGDALPHHPHQTPGMSYQEIEQLHERPARLPASQLDWAEVHYFFAHAGYTIDPRDHLPPAIRYFLPRLAEATVPLQPPMEFDMQLIDSHLGQVKWMGWTKRESEAIHEWLQAWVAAAMRYRSDGWQSLYEVAYEFNSANRDIQITIGIALGAGLPPSDLLTATIGLDEEQLVRLVSHVVMCPDDLPAEAHAVLDPWVSDSSTQKVLMEAALSGKPWSARADLLFGRTAADFI